MTVKLAGLTLVLSACLAFPWPADAELIIRNVDIDDVESRQIVKSATIAVDDGRFTHVGDGEPPQSDDALVIDGSQFVAVPGFINAHTHLWQHVDKGLETSGSLQSWSPLVHQFLHYCTRQEMYEVTLAAASQAVLSGITTVSDFASPYSEFTLDATSSAIKDAGLGGVVMFWNPASFLPPDVKRQEIGRLAGEVAPLELWMAQGHAFLFQPPSVYDGIRIAGDLDLGISEHTMETVQANRTVHAIYAKYVEDYGARLSGDDRGQMRSLVEKGAPSNVDRVRFIERLSRQILADEATMKALTDAEKTRLQAWANLPETMTSGDALNFLGAFDLDKPYLMIHGVWTNSDNVETMARKGVSVVHLPESNMRLSSGIAPVWSYADTGVPVSIGTDGAASNDGISMLRAMRAAWNLQKLEYLDATQTGRLIDAWYILRAATIGGAAALGIADRTGSITVGKEADLVLLSKSRLGLAPIIDAVGIDNLVPLIIYSVNERAIDTVISDGRILVRSGSLLPPFDEGALAASLTTIANAVMRRQAAGKLWRETVDLDAHPAGKPFFQYRSVRKNDTIDLTISNSGTSPRRLTLAMSGETEGGAVAPMLGAETLARFPLDPPPDYFMRAFDLEPGETVKIQKAAGGYDYSVQGSGETITRMGTDEQLLVLAR